MKERAKQRVVMLLVIIIMMQQAVPARQAGAAGASIASNGDGTITVKYNNADGVMTKVLVIKGEKQYQYDLAKGKNTVRIPMTQGNGTYTVIVCRRVKANQYAPVTQKEIKLKMSPARAAFKPAHMVINFKKKNTLVKKAKSLTKKCKTKEEKIKAIWKYLVNNYSYDYAKQKRVSRMTTQYLPNPESTYKSKKGICYDMAALYSAMLRSVGIEAKLETGYSKTVSGYHAWNRVYDSGKKKWYVIDCTYDMCMRKQKGKYSMKKSAKDYNSIVYMY